MNSYQRPCLKCRRLFTPDNNNRSYCVEHKPIIKPKKKYSYKKKGKSAYDDSEYRRNRKIIRQRHRFCVWCGTGGTSQNKLQVDHIIPVSRGGGHELSNLRILCQMCHKKRQGVAHR